MIPIQERESKVASDSCPEHGTKFWKYGVYQFCAKAGIVQPPKEEPEPPAKPPKEEPIKPNKPYRCERCGADCFDYQRGYACFFTITRYYTDLTKRIWHFGVNCGCVEKHKRESQQTCAWCRKREWPDMKKGWLLDYEVKRVFCSPNCHISYHRDKWEQENRTKPSPAPQPKPSQWARQAQFFTPQLNITINVNNPTKPDFLKDIDNLKSAKEKEAMKQAILYYQQSIKELKRQLAESRKPNRTGNQQEQDDYLLALHQNTQKQAQRAYENKYGRGELDSLFGIDQEQKNYWPWIIGGGIVLGLGILIGCLATRKNKKKSN